MSYTIRLFSSMLFLKFFTGFFTQKPGFFTQKPDKNAKRLCIFYDFELVTVAASTHSCVECSRIVV